MSVMILNEKNFEEEVLKADETVLVDFYADWCGPCKMMSPVIDAIATAETRANIKVGKVNVDQNPKLTQKYGIMSIPTILILKNGEVTKSFVGVTSKKAIEEAI